MSPSVPYTLDETITRARATKDALVAGHNGRHDLTPLVEFLRAGRLVAQVHCSGTEHHGVPMSVIVMGAKGWRAQEVRLVMEQVVRSVLPGTAQPAPGELAASLYTDPLSDVREALAVFVARRLADDRVEIHGECHRYEYAETDGGITIRWLPISTAEFRTVHEDAESTLRNALTHSDLDVVIDAILHLDDEPGDHAAALDRATAAALHARGHAVLR